MISKLQELVGGAILIFVGLILMLVYRLCPCIGRIRLSLYLSEECIFVVSIHTVNIGGQFMVLIYLEKMLLYVYLIIFMRTHGNTEESKKVIVILPPPLKMRKKRVKIQKEKNMGRI